MWKNLKVLCSISLWWDGWMASLTWWMWVWVNSRSWWWTGRLGVLWFMGLQRVGHDGATELNWTELNCKIREEISDKFVGNVDLVCNLRHLGLSNYITWVILFEHQNFNRSSELKLDSLNEKIFYWTLFFLITSQTSNS